MNKKIALLCLLLLLPMALLACGGGDGATSDDAPQTDFSETDTEQSAESHAGISVVGVVAERGGLARVSLSFRENPGFEGANLRLYYDADVLTPVSATGPAGGLFMSNASEGAVPPAEGIIPYVSLVWASATPTAEDGELFTVTFRIKETCQADATALTLGIVELQKGGNGFTLPLQPGQIRIIDQE